MVVGDLREAIEKVKEMKKKEVGKIEIGNLNVFEPGWFEALETLAVQKVSEATGEPARVASSRHRCSDEPLLVVTASGRVFHVWYSDITNVYVVKAIRCPRCGQWIPADYTEEHEEFFCF